MFSYLNEVPKRESKLIFNSILFLCFLQLFSDFIESTYIFCLMTLSLNENVLVVILLFSSILLLIFGKNKIPNQFLWNFGVIFFICRVCEPFFDTFLRMISSGLGIGCFMVFFPGYLLSFHPEEKEEESLLLGLGLVIALVSSILLRTINSSIDLSTQSLFNVIGIILAIIGFLLLSRLLLGKQNSNSPSQTGTENESPLSFLSLLRTIIGISSIFFILSFVFSSPVVISRWTNGNYLLIISIIIIVSGLLVGMLLYNPLILSKIPSYIFWVVNGLFVLSFILLIYTNQIFFPMNINSYPIEVLSTSFLQELLLLVMLITFPIIFIDFIKLTSKIIQSTKTISSMKIGTAFTLGGGLYLLLLIFSLLFTTTWGFIPAIGVLFRDQIWVVYFIVCLMLILSLISVSKELFTFGSPGFSVKTKNITLSLVSFLLIITIISGFLVEAKPVSPATNPTSLRLLTYNIQQGVDDIAQKNYDGQLGLIREIDADIIGLQETFKIAGLSDPAMYFANKLNLYSYFGPNGVTGTTGVALLSKYPISNPTTYYHYSENIDHKQTATIEAEITVGTTIYTVYVTHTFGRMSAKSILQNDILQKAQGKTNVIFMGDFNFKPFSEAYNITTTELHDSWWMRYPTGSNLAGENNTRRIDLVFLTPGMTVTHCEYNFDPQSDHPAYWIEIAV